MKRVTIIQRILYQYRVNFYRNLKDCLSENGIELQLIIEENKSRDRMDFLEIFHVKKSHHFKFLGLEIIYQPYLKFLKESDIILLELGNSLLLNYILMFRRAFFADKKIAFWGHSINKQIKPLSLRNRFKTLYFKKVDYWFPYTDKMAEILIKSGFPADRMATIFNTADTEYMASLNKNMDSEAVAALRNRLDIKVSSKVGIFCGRIYKEKRIGFLLDACYTIKKACPDFVMIFIGDGKESYKVKDASAGRDWIKYMGPLFDKDKVACFKLADLFLSPGLVGLSATDSFALEVPMVTTDYPFHSAEAGYIDNGRNGIITADNINSYVDEVLRVFDDKEYFESLKRGCRQSRNVYTLDNMVTRLTDGIKQCLTL